MALKIQHPSHRLKPPRRAPRRGAASSIAVACTGRECLPAPPARQRWTPRFYCRTRVGIHVLYFPPFAVTALLLQWLARPLPNGLPFPLTNNRSGLLCWLGLALLEKGKLLAKEKPFRD